MKRSASAYLLIGLLAIGVLDMAPAQAQNAKTPIAPQESPVAPEKNPPGDIPDTQVFITYRSPLGYQIEVPEGWARSQHENRVQFADKYDKVAVAVGGAKTGPTAVSAKQIQIPALKASGHAVRISRVENVSLPAGQAVRIDYASNSQPNPVTGKRIRLENRRYLFYHGNLLATVTFAAPYGADNVDQWRRMSHSFQWQ